MKTTVTFSDFCDAFRDMDRDSQFSYAGKRALFDYFTQYEEDTGTDIELDVIAICCEYSEDCWEDIACFYSIDIEEAQGDDDEIESIVREYLEYHSIIAGDIPGGCVYLQF